MLETRVEQVVTEEARKAGGDSFHIVPTTVGMPDRVVLLPGGRTVWVELKVNLREEPRAAQKIWHRRAAKKYGIHVVLLHSTAEVRRWSALDFPTPYVCECMDATPEERR